jgi:hypothetical protein
VIAVVVPASFQGIMHPRVLLRYAANIEDAADVIIRQFCQCRNICENITFWEIGNSRLRSEESFAEFYLSNFQVLNIFETAAVINAWPLSDFFSLAVYSMKTELPFLSQDAVNFFAASESPLPLLISSLVLSESPSLNLSQAWKDDGDDSPFTKRLRQS